jgi:D-alanyl-D-alanine-carboxypeptidase/D-alanyl-D-alanine-endopeptidase
MLAAGPFRLRVLLKPIFTWLALASLFLGVAQSRAAPPGHPSDDYIGVFTIDENSRFTIVSDPTGKLYVRMTGQPFFPLTPVAEDRFTLNGGVAEVQFSRNNGPKVSDLTLVQGGDEIAASRTDAPVPNVIFPDPDVLLDYLGKYQFASGVQYEVSMKAHALWVRFVGQAIYPVYPDKADHFLYDIVDASLTFERDAKGGVTGLVLHRGSSDQHATKVP